MTSLTVELSELRKKVNFVRHALGASKTDLSVLLIRLNVVGNKATLFAASKELFAFSTMKVARAEGEKDGSFAVAGAKLEQLTARTEAEKVNLTWDNEGLEAQAGFLTVNFELYDEAQLRTTENQLQPIFGDPGISVSRDAIEEALVCAKSCTTSNAVRPDVSHAELRNGRMLSSDGRKILVYTHDAFNDKLTLKVPSSILSNAISSIKNVDTPNLELNEGEAYYVLKANRGEYVLGIRKTERTFPQVEDQVANAKAPTDMVAIDKAVLEAMLRGVAMGLPSDEVKVTLQIAGSGREAYLECSAYNQLGRRSFERASIGRNKDKKEELNLPISFKHMLDTLSVFKGDSIVDLLVMDKMQMLMVKDKTEAREVMTIIPFRTDQQIEREKKEAEQIAEARKKTAAEEAEENSGTEMAADAIGDLDDEPEGELELT